VTGPTERRATELDDRHLPAIVALHARVFPDAVLTELGPEVLDRYYRWQVLGPHDVLALGVASPDGDGLDGLVLGGRFRGSMIGFVKQHPALLARQLLRHPGIVLQGRGRAAVRTGVRLLLRPARTTRIERPERVPAGSFGVLVVAVDPGAQRRGVGRALLAEVEDRARQAGYERMHLTLDPTNAAATSFYRRLGWEPLGLPGDTDRATLVGKELPDADPG
jgi:ribosomal protein S18 acetylase RimI-like enzyme